MSDIKLVHNKAVIEVTLVEEFEYYDRPVLYSAKTATGQLYLFVWAAVDNEKQKEIWLMVPISPQRLEGVQTGEVSLHDTFKSPADQWLWLVEVGLMGQHPTGKIVNPNDIPDSMLSTPIANLNQ